MATSVNEGKSTSVTEQKLAKKKSRLFIFALASVTMAIALAVTLVFFGVSSKEEQLLDSIAKREELLASGRSHLVTTWLEDLSQQGDRLINSELFRIYASEVDVLQGDVSLLLSETGQELMEQSGKQDEETFMLAAQLPMMNRLLEEFVSYSGFLSGRIINKKSQTYIATDANVTSLTKRQIEAAGQVMVSGKPYFSALHSTPTGMVMDISLPIFQTAEGDQRVVVAVLQLSKLVSGKVTEFLANSPLVEQGYRTRLVQRSGDVFERIVPWEAEGLFRLENATLFDQAETIPFGLRGSVADGSEVYSYAMKIPTLDWWIVMEIDHGIATKELKSYTSTVTGIAVLATSALAFLFGVLWWWLVGRENRAVADEFRQLAETIEEQKIFLDSINATIPELIGLKDAEGIYVFANHTFAAAVGRSPEEMVGLDDSAVFGYDTAKRLAASDERVLAKGTPVSVNETIYLRSQKHHFQISKVPFEWPGAKARGILSVFRDNTDVVEAQERSKQVVQQTTDALVRTIEEIDPYLGGHTRLMGEFSVEIARRMHMNDLDVTTVEAAANLSQIGKVFVDRDILNKPGKLTPEEFEAMKRHVEYSHNILKDIDFKLPVVEAIYQMNENPDGSGYPKGLKGSEIILPARILAVANGFCALIRPRSYRPAKPVEESLRIMEECSNQYSTDLVKVLREIVQSPIGEKLLKPILPA
ncbi:MAG: HD domain-containing phosphohydrolase [Desulfovibrionaceae bacterium]